MTADVIVTQINDVGLWQGVITMVGACATVYFYTVKEKILRVFRFRRNNKQHEKIADL